MNKLSTEKRAIILRCLVEGNSIRATVRMTEASKNTVTKLLRECGEACKDYQEKTLFNLPCTEIQCDEIWSFVGCKEKTKEIAKGKHAGDVWTWTSLCADTKLVPFWHVGKREAEDAYFFMQNLAVRLKNRVQLTTDGHKPYLVAVEEAFGEDIDFARLVKLYGNSKDGKPRKGGSIVVGAKKVPVIGNPSESKISTSFVERQNLTMRMSMRRFTRSTNAFSKKVENHEYAIALHFMYYNFCRIHQTLKTTPAIKAEVCDKVWSIEDVIEMMDKYTEKHYPVQRPKNYKTKKVEEISN